MYNPMSRDFHLHRTSVDVLNYEIVEEQAAALGRMGRALAAAFEKGGWDRVTRLYRRGDVPEEQCWLKGPDWCLAYA